MMKQPSAGFIESERGREESEATLSVTGLTKAIRSLLEGSFTDVVVEGEISNFIDHRSGHRYWTLKDSEAQISSVFWKSRPLNFQLKDGMKVVCRGRLTVYPPRGNYQLDVFQVRPSGIGELQRAYEELYAKLSAEGLFEESRKRPIPRFPRTIGIVTSENGAALHDILTCLRRRYPVVNVILRPAAVQGVGAELEIARAIQEFNLIPNDERGVTNDELRMTNEAQTHNSSFSTRNYPRPDVLIVGRGGGSLEDLWCFNEEAVARAIFASKIPVISAVGHEVDLTIADFVADLRAPTPTAAAELATPHRRELENIIDGSTSAIMRTVSHELAMRRQEVETLSDPATLLASMKATIGDRKNDVDRMTSQVSRAMRHGVERFRLQLERDTAKLSAMNPDRVLDRGFTALESADGEIIPRLEKLLSAGEKNGILVFADGRITVRFD